MSPLAIQLAKAFRAGQVRRSGDRLRVGDLIEHLVSTGTPWPEATTAARECLSELLDRRQRREDAPRPTCPRCQGWIIPEKVFDEDEMQDVTFWRCPNCGDRGDPVIELNRASLRTGTPANGGKT